MRMIENDRHSLHQLSDLLVQVTGLDIEMINIKLLKFDIFNVLCKIFVQIIYKKSIKVNINHLRLT